MKDAWRVLGLLVALLCMTPAIQAADIRFASGKSALAIPFELADTRIDNHIFLQVSINGSSPLYFILDTGASHTILSLRNAKSLSLKLQPIGKVVGGIGAEHSDAYLVSDKVSLELPGVVLSDRSLVAVPLDMTEQCIGTRQGPKRVVDGILGADFFRSFVVEIDYAARLINLYDPASYSYAGKGRSLPLQMDPSYIFVQAQLEAAGRALVTARLVVDTGSGAALSLLKKFAETNRLLPSREKLAAVPDCGINGPASEPALVGELDALQLADVKISKPVTVFYKEAPAPGDGLLGNPVLRKFKVIFDYSRNRMILERKVTNRSPIRSRAAQQ